MDRRVEIRKSEHDIACNLLQEMKEVSIGMIRQNTLVGTKDAWHYSHLNCIDFVEELGLITEEERKKLRGEFRNEVRNGDDKCLT